VVVHIQSVVFTEIDVPFVSTQQRLTKYQRDLRFSGRNDFLTRFHDTEIDTTSFGAFRGFFSGGLFGFMLRFDAFIRIRRVATDTTGIAFTGYHFHFMTA
jgi:hypothetical protein